MGRRKKEIYRIKEILKMQGKDVKWFANELKMRFKINKRITYARVNNEIGAHIHDNLYMAIVLKVKLKEIYSLNY